MFCCFCKANAVLHPVKLDGFWQIDVSWQPWELPMLVCFASELRLAGPMFHISCLGERGGRAPAACFRDPWQGERWRVLDRPGGRLRR